MSTSNGTKSSILSEIVPILEGEASTSGLVVNDPMGLSIVAEGNLTSDHAGVYTNLLRLAAQLPTSQTTTSEVMSSTIEVPTAGKPNSCVVTIEMEDASIVIKDYYGYTIALEMSNATSNIDAAVSTPNRKNHVVPSSDPVHAILSESSSMEPDSTHGPKNGASDLQ